MKSTRPHVLIITALLFFGLAYIAFYYTSKSTIYLWEKVVVYVVVVFWVLSGVRALRLLSTGKWKDPF